MSLISKSLLSLILLNLLLPLSLSCQIDEVLPNPYGDDGREYVKITCDENCTLTDFESTFSFGKGSYTIVNNFTAFENFYKKVPDAEGLRLANSGERIQLTCRNTSVSFNWKELLVDEGILYFHSKDGWDFKYEDWSSFKPVREEVRGRIIITPAEYVFEGKGYLASYTITQENFKGDFEIALDASPVGGLPAEEVFLARKYPVHFLEGSYRNFHYKYAVSGNSVVITTENWKWDNRGIIVEFESIKIARALKELFENDLKYEGEHGKISGVRDSKSFKDGRTMEFDGDVELYILPDRNPVFDFIENSKGFLYIAAPYIDFAWFGDGSPLLDALLNASERGVKIRIMLNNYNRNKEVVEFLNEIPNISAKMIDGNSFDELHAKYMVTDGKALITSANFNKYGLKLNRELALVIYDRKSSVFLKEVFENDWKGKEEINPAFSLFLLGLALLAGFYFVRRLS